MLAKINRLKKRKEFNYIYKKGQVAHAVDFSVHFVRAFKPYAQIGISVSKTVGNSVVRSRVKRIISEACRLDIDKFAVKNYVITAKPPIVDKKSTDIEAELLALLKKNHLLKEGNSTEQAKQQNEQKFKTLQTKVGGEKVKQQNTTKNEDKKPLNQGTPKSQTSQTQAVKPETEKIEKKTPLKNLGEQKVKTLQTKAGEQKANGQKLAEIAINSAKKPKDGKAKRGKNV